VYPSEREQKPDVVVVISSNPVEFRFHAQDETAELVLEAELAAAMKTGCRPGVEVSP
jgi:hypothetical protein